jgi:hypothetical protein
MRIYTHLYEVLGLDPAQEVITQQEIKKAYYVKARECHPDKEGGSAEAMQEVNNAYEVLGDPNLRAEYDAAGIGDVSPEKTEIKGAKLLYTLLQQVLQPPPEGQMGDYARLLGLNTSGSRLYRNFEKTDFVVELKKLAAQSKQSVEEQIKEHEEKERYFTKLLAKLERKQGVKGPDVLSGMLRSQQASHAGAVAQGKEVLEEVVVVLELLETYTFSFDSPAPMPAPRGYATGGYILGEAPIHYQPREVIVVDREACQAASISDPKSKCRHHWAPTSEAPKGYACIDCGCFGMPLPPVWGKETMSNT